jgi:hypothetical protein
VDQTRDSESTWGGGAREGEEDKYVHIFGPHGAFQIIT